MNVVFADSFFFLSLLNKNEAQHERAREFSDNYQGKLLTTALVLTELADGLAHPKRRKTFIELYDNLVRNSAVQIIGSSDELLSAGFELYRNRLDKAWSLTDCVSFVVMQRHHITEALTGDHHFEQAGFMALLK
jgi:uncharacterized protein